jgi:hypothetical protein
MDGRDEDLKNLAYIGVEVSGRVSEFGPGFLGNGLSVRHS